MKTDSLKSFFLWLSNTDEKLYAICPQNVKRGRVALGIFVLITGVFALITGSYFVKSMFADYNEITRTVEVSAFGWIASIMFGLLWGFLIIMIDREIVSAHSKWSAAIRIPLAIVIGLALAIPFKVLFFSSRINKELLKSSRQENAVYEVQKNNSISEVNDKIKTLEARIDNERNKMAHWSAVMEAEAVGRIQSGRTGKAGKGDAYTEAERNFDLHKAFEQQYIDELQSVKESKNFVVEMANNNFQNSKIDQTYDFLSQYEQMEIMKENNEKLARFALLITLLLILVETTPAIMKLLRPSDEYDALLQVRTNISKQMAFAYGNFAMDEIQNAKNISILSNMNFQYSPKEIIKQISLNMV